MMTILLTEKYPRPIIRRRSRYRPTGAPLVLTSTRLQILQHISECGVVSSISLARVMRLPLKTLLRSTRHLFDAKAISVIPIPRAVLAEPNCGTDIQLLWGSARNHFQITRAGQKLLFQKGLTDTMRIKATYGPGNWRHLAHAVFIADARLYFTAAALANPPCSIERWVQEREAITTTRGPRGARVRVNPDVHIVMRLSSNAAVSCLIELDRGTECRKRWAEKLANYATLLTSPQLVNYTGYKRARLLIVANSSSRRTALARFVAELQPQLCPSVWLADPQTLATDLFDIPSWIRADDPTTYRPLLTSDQLIVRSKPEETT